MRNATSLLVVLLWCTGLASSASAERNIVLPHTEDFEDPASLADIAWVGAGNGGAVTRVQASWRGGTNGCARLDPPTATQGGTNGGYLALGAFLFTATDTLTVAFALNVGTTYSSSAADAGGSLINKFIDIFGPGNRSGLLGLNNRGACGHEFGLLDANTEVYYYYATPPTGTPACRSVHFAAGSGADDLAGRWLWINYTVNHSTGQVALRLWDREGTTAGMFFQIQNGTDRATNEIRTIGGYYNEYHPTADSESRLLIDDLEISDSPSAIPPPLGFVGGAATPDTGLLVDAGVATEAGAGIEAGAGTDAAGSSSDMGTSRDGAVTQDAARVAPATDDGGCGCELTSPDQAVWPALVLLLLGMWLGRRARYS